MLSKSTHVFAHHGIPLECDVYTRDASSDTHVFLYFHPGGLSDWGREWIAPWLVQGLLDDVTAAYEFAKRWDIKDGREGRVIVGGASSGSFAATLIAHHCSPPPLALFGISAIHTFQHPFFSSSTLLTPEPIRDADVAQYISGPLQVGKNAPGSESTFTPERLLPDGSKNPSYEFPKAPVVQDPPRYGRGMLYEYFIYENAWPGMLRDVDPGYGWAQDEDNRLQVDRWPPTVLIHGDADKHVPLSSAEQMKEALGGGRVRLFVAEGQEHLFEWSCFIEEDRPGMGAVRDALQCLDGVIDSSLEHAERK
ncbi:hypothetical protein ACJ41O_000953 [Fusarium nematophilum]